jgi:hypothetical protein
MSEIRVMNQVQEEAGLMITVDQDGPLDQELNGDESEHLPVKLAVTPGKRPRGRPRKNQTVARPVNIICHSLFRLLFCFCTFLPSFYLQLFKVNCKLKIEILSFHHINETVQVSISLAFCFFHEFEISLITAISVDDWLISRIYIQYCCIIAQCVR